MESKKQIILSPRSHTVLIQSYRAKELQTDILQPQYLIQNTNLANGLNKIEQDKNIVLKDKQISSESKYQVNMMKGSSKGERQSLKKEKIVCQKESKNISFIDYEKLKKQKIQEITASFGVSSYSQKCQQEEIVGTGDRMYLKIASTYSRKNAPKMNNFIPKITEQISKNDAIICHSCPNKKAKYHLLNSPNIQIFLCSKCSIKMLQKGYEVEQIEIYYGDKVQQMRTKILMFMDKINSIHTATKENLSQIQINQSYSSIQIQRKIIQQTYSEIIEALLKVKSQSLKNLNDIEDNLKQQRQKACRKLISQLNDLEQMQKVIQSTYQHLEGCHEFKVQRMIDIFTDDLMEFQQYQFVNRPVETQLKDNRIQKILGKVYDEIMLDPLNDQQYYQIYQNEGNNGELSNIKRSQQINEISPIVKSIEQLAAQLAKSEEIDQ